MKRIINYIVDNLLKKYEIFSLPVMEIISQQNVWLIPFFPFLASIISGLVLFLFPGSIKSIRQLCFLVSTSFLLIAMFGSFYIFYQQITGSPIQQFFWSWIINKSITLELGYLIDPLTSIMLVLVTTIGVIVMIYSHTYMFYDQGYIRFFCYLSLFTASMLGLVISPNLIQIYIFWELVGMCSYLLIGFWFTRPSVANACQKAFITNRVGDFGLLLGILGIYWITGSFEFQTLFERFFELLNHNKINTILPTLCAIFLFLGPIAKSAQFPLHIWLPDAMEGPTPISALIHAATMVAAGIFLVARMYPFFEMLPIVMTFIAWIGAITALLGAVFAITQRDLKKGLAYSTMSQLGYMMLSLGIGSYKAALFHLITHAYSKALLFLGSGSVIHSIEPILGYHPQKSQNISFFGGLRKHMPITASTFLFGTLSLCGIPPFACFWSKDEILTDSWSYFPFLGFLAIFTAGLTAFYMFRLYILTFEGDFRGNLSNEYPFYSLISIWDNPLLGSNNMSLIKLQTANKKEILYPRESKNFMLLSLIILTIPTLLIGFIGGPPIFQENNSDFLSNWLRLSINSLNNIHSENLIEFFQSSLFSLSIVFLGIFTAFFIYRPHIKTGSKVGKFQPIMLNSNSVFVSMYNWSYYRGYIDDFYYLIFVKGIRFTATYLFLLDQWFIDGIVNGIGILSFFGGEIMKYIEGGRISSYLFFLVFCMLFLFFLYSYI